MNFQSSDNNENQIEGYGKIRQIFQWLLLGLAVNAPGGASLRPLLHRLRGTKIGKRAWIGLHVLIDSQYPQAISLGDDCIIGLRTSIIAHLNDYFVRPVVIEKGAFIGPHCVILPGVRIGENAVIRACTVVSTNVPPNTLWGGPNPKPIAKITVPYVRDVVHYKDFLLGLRPIPKKTKPDRK